jgi:ABC-type phosphate transport system substrate-binding protein
MKKLTLILGVTITTLFACSKSDSKKDTSGACFECTIEEVLIKYCQKNSNTATITANGNTEEDNFTSGWDQYVSDTKKGVAELGGTCK